MCGAIPRVCNRKYKYWTFQRTSVTKNPKIHINHHEVNLANKVSKASIIHFAQGRYIINTHVLLILINSNLCIASDKSTKTSLFSHLNNQHCLSKKEQTLKNEPRLKVQMKWRSGCKSTANTFINQRPYSLQSGNHEYHKKHLRPTSCHTPESNIHAQLNWSFNIHHTKQSSW